MQLSERFLFQERFLPSARAAEPGSHPRTLKLSDPELRAITIYNVRDRNRAARL